MEILITSLMAESEEELKSLLMKVKEGSEKVGLKTQHLKKKKTKKNSTFRKIRSWLLVPSLHDKYKGKQQKQ